MINFVLQKAKGTPGLMRLINKKVLGKLIINKPSATDMSARVITGFLDIVQSIDQKAGQEKHIIIVTHGGVLYRLYQYLEPEKAPIQSLRMPNAGISYLEYSDSNRAPFTVKFWGSKEHLHQIAVLQQCDDV